MKQIYLDYAAITPVSKAVEKRMLFVQQKSYGNPSSLHALGLDAKRVLDESRKTIADILHGKVGEVVFTSGGTESANLALLGVARKALSINSHVRPHIITSVIEHHAVLNPCKQLQNEGCDVSYIPVGAQGIVTVKEIIAAIRPETILVSVMYANNEIGTIQPISAIGKELKKINKDRASKGLSAVLFHSDACQTAGFLDLNVEHLGVDLLTLNGSKMYGPRHTGILFIRHGVTIEPLLYGGGQEHALRSGTEDVAAAAGFAAALQEADRRREKESTRLIKLRDYFFAELQKNIPGVDVNGAIAEDRLPNNVNVSIPNTEGESLVIYLSAKGVYCSTGSACSSAFTEPSHVILAVSGGSLSRAKNSVRFTLGLKTTKGQVNAAMKILLNTCKQMRYTVQV